MRPFVSISQEGELALKNDGSPEFLLVENPSPEVINSDLCNSLATASPNVHSFAQSIPLKRLRLLSGE